MIFDIIGKGQADLDQICKHCANDSLTEYLQHPRNGDFFSVNYKAACNHAVPTLDIGSEDLGPTL